MNISLETVTKTLKNLRGERPYNGTLTPYAIESIEAGKVSYTAANLLAYLEGYRLEMIITDLNTEDAFTPKTVMDIHKVFRLIMDRYNIDVKTIYKKTFVNYTSPKSFDEQELEKMKAKGNKHPAPLSVKTLVAVCNALNCNLEFRRI